MAKPLGALFLDAALAPSADAGRLVMDRQVTAAFQLLTRSMLLGAVYQGVDQVARRTGFLSSEITRFLPLPELDQLADKIALSALRGGELWHVHTRHLGGLWRGVANLTIDARPPDLTLCLIRIATKMKRDSALAKPLRELAAEVDDWQQLLVECSVTINDRPELLEAYRSRRHLRIAVAAVATLLFGGAAAAALWTFVVVRAAQQRVDAVLAQGDPCAAESVAGEDLRWASERQESALEKGRVRCSELREQHRQERERKLREKRQADQRERDRQQREADCAAMVAAVRSGRFGAEHEVAAGDSAGLMRRMAHDALLPIDLSPTAPELPCADTPSGPELSAHFVKSVLASTHAWVNADDVSERVTTILTEHRTQLDQRHVEVFGFRADTLAKKAMMAGEEPAITSAARLCTLADALGASPGGACQSAQRHVQQEDEASTASSEP